ncbi:hypothetical protein B296_00047259 [Ensete ventricosum]|uniref:RRM domain-containing protein n=1 Tax=Ensete ventricosum TaxID=4639 RepID=A0A426Z0A1_ENSVE|nr:hypothetical protein B296_00047259 [Ensete ventricosum]
MNFFILLFQGRKLRCSLSQAKHRLFIGNVPKSLAEDELRKILEDSGPGVEHIEMFKFLQVKAIYVKNLPENVSSERLKELFERNGEVTKVVLPPAKAGQGKRDFGFVHFADRSSALKAVKATEKFEIDGKYYFYYFLQVCQIFGNSLGHSPRRRRCLGGVIIAVAVLAKAEVGGEAMETVDAATALTDSVVILHNAMRAKSA